VCVASDDWRGVVDANRGLCSFERPREVYISFRRSGKVFINIKCFIFM
jgi:hypothetical protein